MKFRQATDLSDWKPYPKPEKREKKGKVPIRKKADSKTRNMTTDVAMKKTLKFLTKKFPKRAFLTNMFFFDGFECDILEIDLYRKTTTDYEIKTDTGDFWADLKKDKKHRRLSMGDGFIPNEFYFVVPEGMIKADDDRIPIYAGLIYITSNGLKTVKMAHTLTNEQITTAGQWQKLTGKLTVMCNEKIQEQWQA